MLTVAVRVLPDQPDQIFEVAYGTILTPPKIPEREGYVMVGWQTEGGLPFDFSQPITENVTVVAIWEQAKVTITFDATTNGPAGVQNPESVTILRGERVAEPVVENDQYIIVYWTLDGERYNFDEPVYEDITLVAVWVPVVEVDFDADGGTPEPESQRVPEGGYATRPEDPVKEGCEFEGWAEEEVVYYPVTVVPYDDGTGSYVIQVVSGKTLPTQPQPPTQSDRCTWDGWYKNGSKYDFSQPVTESFTLEGKWVCKATVTFEPNMEGLSNFTEETTVGTPVEKPEDPVDPSGECKFDGWEKEGE